MSIIKDIFWLLFAALIGYILYKVYQAVASASGSGGGSSGNTDTLASMALNSPVQDNWLNPSLPADNSTTDLGGGWNVVGNP